MKNWSKSKPLVIAILFAVLLLMLAAGTRFGRALFASHEGFAVLSNDTRIHSEEGAEDQAAYLASVLNQSVEIVETRLGLPFKHPIEIYVCASQERFNRHVPVGLNASGAVFLDRLYISPRAFELASAAPILMHELVHLHLRQHLGTRAFQSNLPGWFQEGLAVAVSDGGGAVQVDTPSAIAAILSGRTFEPEDHGSWFRPKMARDHGIQHHMFYRQSGMFVSYLESQNPEQFRRFIQSLVNGDEFSTAFELLGGSVAEMWMSFIGTLRDNSLAIP